MKTLSKLEFDLLNTLIQLDRSLSGVCANVLFNIQVSGGKDSMCLLHAFVRVINSKLFKSQNNFLLAVQHFNHKMRNKQSDEDANFVARACLKMGVPVFLSDLDDVPQKANFQNHARMFRKEQSAKLCERLSKEWNCSQHFIVTAHHARDHVESVLQHILRGSGLNGLRGIQKCDAEQGCFRPFASTCYQDITEYCHENKISFREDSSNSEDKYQRNYIRHHILPHLEYLNSSYEDSFQKLSYQVDEMLPFQKRCKKSSLDILKSTSASEVFRFFQVNQTDFLNLITRNSIHNILHEAQLLFSAKSLCMEKKIPLKSNGKVLLKKKSRDVVEMIPTHDTDSKKCLRFPGQ